LSERKPIARVIFEHGFNAVKFFGGFLVELNTLGFELLVGSQHIGAFKYAKAKGSISD
jgi:hypothetical protein